jgi:hypothetical protein
MSRGAHSFRHGDIAKVVKAVVKAGVSVKRVEIANGRIMMFAGEPEAGEPEEAAAPQIDVDANEWDSVQ